VKVFTDVRLAEPMIYSSERRMPYLVSASFALFAITASHAALASDDESFISQMPPGGPNLAFVEQLPETAIVPTTGPAEPQKKAAARVASKRVSPKHVVAVHSIFPNIGNGVNARANSAAAGVVLPTVGGGVTQSL
jgi:hypothetical protein